MIQILTNIKILTDKTNKAKFIFNFKMHIKNWLCKYEMYWLPNS